jgi:hypothetical protein
MRRLVAALLVGAVAIAGCGGGSGGDPDRERLARAEVVLTERPNDPAAFEAVMRAAYQGANSRQDSVTGRYTPDARPYLDRAAALWRPYLGAAFDRPSLPVASLMVQVFGNGLGRPEDAASAAHYVTDANPNATSYLQLAAWEARAGDPHEARLAGQKALELADPSERDDVRSRIRALITQAG